MIGHNHHKKKEYEKAEDVLSEALTAALENNNKEYVVLAYNSMYNVFLDKGHFIEAEECIRKCADILEALGDMEKLACCYTQMGEFYKKIYRSKESIYFFKKAMECIVQSKRNKGLNTMQ
jgi:tetratricopeptide (TPR) repeat protein